MRFVEFKQRTAKPLLEAEARIQHAEDIVFWEGSKGAMRALQSLRNMAGDTHKEVTIKWDGSPAIIFGRDDDGEFIFTDKSGFNAKRTNGRAKSPDELEDILLSRSGGKFREDPNRIAFANKMKDAFALFEKATPKEYRGFFKGDLLYYTTPDKVDGNYVFKPNIVEYAVDVNSDLGKRIGASTAGIVIHRQVDAEGNEGPLQDADIFQGKDVLVVPPVSVEQPAQVDNTQLDQLEQVIKKNAAGIDELLNAQELREKQLSDFANILYTYTNSKVDTGLDNLGADFSKWLEASPKISDKKKVKVLEHVKQHINAFNALWQTVQSIMQTKDDVIAQFDAHDADVKQSINGQSGGEGYVLAHPEGDIKLVPRSTFTAANRAVER